jgi:hypothetical protein
MDESTRKSFNGTVLLKEWRATLDGRSARGFTGRVSILTAQEAVGFEVNDRDSRWLAKIEGPTQTYWFPGCEVAGVVEHPLGNSGVASEHCIVP